MDIEEKLEAVIKRIDSAHRSERIVNIAVLASSVCVCATLIGNAISRKLSEKQEGKGR